MNDEASTAPGAAGAWVVRGGEHGEWELAAIEGKVVAIGWGEVPDLYGMSHDQLGDAVAEAYGKTRSEASNRIGQISTFARLLSVGDVLVMPRKNQKLVRLGRVTGEYRYNADGDHGLKHVRSAIWEEADIRREELPPEVTPFLGDRRTVSPIPEHAADALRSLMDSRSTLESPRSWWLNPGDRIKRTELHRLFQGSGQGGIARSKTTPNVMVSLIREAVGSMAISMSGVMTVASISPDRAKPATRP